MKNGRIVYDPLYGFIRLTETEYRTLTAAAQAYGHKLIAMAPCDINKAKQVNILVSDMGYSLSDIVIYPSTAALGYGMEYIYSILERGRLAALSGDRLMAQPVLLDVGYEAWRVKEARSDEMASVWGPLAMRGPAWETLTATNLLQGGADLLILRHPQAVQAVRKTIDQLFEAAFALPGEEIRIPRAFLDRHAAPTPITR